MSRLTELAAYLISHDDYAVLGHVNPDGDACGSCIALALALKKLGKCAFVLLPGGIPEKYSRFACSVEVSAGEGFPFVPKTALALDVSERSRLGAGEACFDSCAHSAMLDHHPTNPGFGEMQFVDGMAAATGELVVELIDALGVEMDVEMATWLYIAICTDCGRFGFSSTRPQTMCAAADCLRAGIDVDQIHRELYSTRSEGSTRLLGLVLSGMELDEERQLCWARLTQDMLVRAGALREDSDGIVNYLLEVRGVRFAALAEERGAQTKFSLRSKPPYAIAGQVAQALDGGGHPCAAGVTLDSGMEEALGKVLDAARAALKG